MDELPGVKLMTNHGGGNFKKQFARADKWGARVAVVLGESEVANGTAVVKDCALAEQRQLREDSVARIAHVTGKEEKTAWNYENETTR